MHGYSVKQEHSGRFSNKLVIVQFLLSILVVFIHTIGSSNITYPEFTSGCYYCVSRFFVNVGHMAVPTFFVISGFLFFNQFSWAKLKDKLVRRFFSLLVPYVIWNSYYYFAYLLLANVPIFQYEPTTFSIVGYISAGIKSTNTVLWYIRTLTLYVLIGPLFVLLWRNRYVALASIAALIVLNYAFVSVKFVGIFTYYLPMFLIGAYMAIYRPKLVLERSPVRVRAIACAAFLGALVIAALYGPLGFGDRYLYTIRLLGSYSIWFVFDCFAFNTKPAWWLRTSFPIYVLHSIPVRFMKKLATSTLPHTQGIAFAQMFITPIVVVALILGIHAFMSGGKYRNRVWNVMMGNRAARR